jgi:hypothetical protein
VSARNHIKTLLAATAIGIFLGLGACKEIPADGGSNDDKKNDTIDNHPLKYEGFISEFRFDMDQNGQYDIIASSAIVEDDFGGLFQFHYFNLSNDLKLLSHNQLMISDYSKNIQGVLSNVEKGTEIIRGLEDMAYEEDYIYGPKLTAVGITINSDAAVIQTWSSPIANAEEGYLAVMMETGSGPRFGWIEYEIESEPIVNTGVPYDRPTNDFIAKDAKFRVTDAYLNPTLGEAVIAGEK